MPEVNKARVQLWVDALRSGEFTQARGVLEARDLYENGLPQVTGHCCLGVAQHVALRNGWDPLVGHTDLDWGRAGLDHEAGKWFGFGVSDRADPKLTESTSCVEANDQLGWSFEQIADALEARYINTSTESHDNG